MSRTVIFDELCGDHKEFRANYVYDDHGWPLKIVSLKRKSGKRKTVKSKYGVPLLMKLLGGKEICKLAEKTQKVFDVSKRPKSKRRRRQLVGGRR